MFCYYYLFYLLTVRGYTLYSTYLSVLYTCIKRDGKSACVVYTNSTSISFLSTSGALSFQPTTIKASIA